MFEKLFTAFFIFLAAAAANAQPIPTENSDGAISALTSYYEALNSKDYRAAYSRWQSPPVNYGSFQKEHRNYKNFRLIIEPPSPSAGATGSSSLTVPAFLLAKTARGETERKAGCFTLTRGGFENGNAPEGWLIARADLKPASKDASIPELLENSCRQPETSDDPKAGSRVLGIISYGTENLSDVIKAPAAVRVNEEFEVEIITTGNGCVSSGGADVVQHESSADVFVYDLTVANKPGVMCTMILKQLSHKAKLKFEKPGQAVIRVWGREQGGNDPLGKPVIVEKFITVR